MARWQPEARARLERAALDLYTERGFENTTVAEIAARAGLTERTFFRYFADKREVLFGGSQILEQRMTAAIARAPETAPPIDAVGNALAAAAELLEERRELVRLRQRVIAANDDLREREFAKLASLASTMAAVLRSRGASGSDATWAAEAAVLVFRVAFERWVSAGEQVELAHLMRQSLGELRSVAGGG